MCKLGAYECYCEEWRENSVWSINILSFSTVFLSSWANSQGIHAMIFVCAANSRHTTGCVVSNSLTWTAKISETAKKKKKKKKHRVPLTLSEGAQEKHIKSWTAVGILSSCHWKYSVSWPCATLDVCSATETIKKKSHHKNIQHQDSQTFLPQSHSLWNEMLLASSDAPFKNFDTCPRMFLRRFYVCDVFIIVYLTPWPRLNLTTVTYSQLQDNCIKKVK